MREVEENGWFPPDVKAAARNIRVVLTEELEMMEFPRLAYVSLDHLKRHRPILE